MKIAGELALGIALGAALSACSDGSEGAVSVRWRIVDLRTGSSYDPRQQFGTQPPGGECYCAPQSAPGGCPGSLGWRIDRVRIRVRDPQTGASARSPDGPLDEDPKFVFDCVRREATTPFRVPVGSWAVALETFNKTPAAVDGGIVEDPSGITPPPVVRTVRAASIVNLDVVEVGVDPLPQGPTTTNTDGGVP